ncbi:hypothetical protein [Nonomuraea cavernae]|nr:hypothetical protein [Nonomuraea cavernae]MCA2188845.1 hypothetical protein [Nonomuraea cavernae]
MSLPTSSGFGSTLITRAMSTALTTTYLAWAGLLPGLAGMAFQRRDL